MMDLPQLEGFGWAPAQHTEKDNKETCNTETQSLLGLGDDTSRFRKNVVIDLNNIQKSMLHLMTIHLNCYLFH